MASSSTVATAGECVLLNSLCHDEHDVVLEVVCAYGRFA